LLAQAQSTFPVNGVADERHITYAFTHAVIHADHRAVIDSATLLVRDRRVVAAGRGVTVPAGAVVYDLRGKHVYPSFIDLVSGYGLPKPEKAARQRFPEPRFVSGKAGAYDWNEAIRPEQDAAERFKADDKASGNLRKAGFGAVLTQVRDGIARGTAALVTTGEGRENDLLLSSRAATWYSFDKGTSQQDYPGSQMGCIALLRQTFLDARRSASGAAAERNLSLDAWNASAGLPRFFEVTDKLAFLRAAAIGREFDVRFVIKGAGDEYQRLGEIKGTGLPVVIPVTFPDAFDVSDPADALKIPLSALKHWESAPANAARLHAAGVEFAVTADGIDEPRTFFGNLRKAMAYGLDEAAVLKALTYTPARLVGMGDSLGSLRAGMIASFFITPEPVFSEDAAVLEHWVAGKRHVVVPPWPADLRGTYRLVIGPDTLSMAISGHEAKAGLTVREDTAARTGTLESDADQILIGFALKKGGRKGAYRLAGRVTGGGNLLEGTAFVPGGLTVPWSAQRLSPDVHAAKKDTAGTAAPSAGDVLYPDMAYGFRTMPLAHSVLFRNATVWTNESEGILDHADVLVRDGRIERVGKNLDAGPGTEVVDATGKHLTAGIIDEHSHIAVSGPVNECTQAITAEVRIGDVLNSDDINIYRQLAGGVTAAQLLHGSCNPIGGQSQIIKLRWGRAPEGLKLERAPAFIKFALGENVKQSNWGDNQQTRYPQTRMGVEQVYVDAFTRAREYRERWKRYRAGRSRGPAPRRDLELEALAEILDGHRYITCHSYRQSEINMLLHVADRFGIRVNTFTHILEGYKVADKMKARGSGASTFSDWWAYKFEVYEAIPYNGALMHDVGLVVAYNSDDPEMARRLNQEAAKAVRYGGVSEEEAWKFVTLNPARLLHVDDRMGSVRAGKDADLVLWSGNPLSVYSRVLRTYVDGILYFDERTDGENRAYIEKERARLVGRMLEEGREGKDKPVVEDPDEIRHCIDEEVIR